MLILYLTVDIRHTRTHMPWHDIALLILLQSTPPSTLGEFPLVQTTGKAINYNRPYTAACVSALPPKKITSHMPCKHTHAQNWKYGMNIYGGPAHTQTHIHTHTLCCAMDSVSNGWLAIGLWYQKAGQLLGFPHTTKPGKWKCHR